MNPQRGLIVARCATMKNLYALQKHRSSLTPRKIYVLVIVWILICLTKGYIDTNDPLGFIKFLRKNELFTRIKIDFYE